MARRARSRAVVAAALLASALGGCARGLGGSAAGGEPVHVAGLETRVRAEVRAGPATGGYVQTPIGGQPGTTSPRRPTFDELDVGTAWAPTADLRFAFGRHRVRAGASWWVLHGSDVLRQDLITHGDTYVAGTELASETEILAHWLGYGYAFGLGSTPGRLTITPGVGLFGYGQRYAVEGDGRSSTRDFTAYSPMFDAELVWYPGGRIHVSSELRLALDEALGISSPSNWVEAAVRLHLDLWRDANVYLAAGYTRIEHYDEQTVPNHGVLEVPWFGLGCELRF